MTQYVVVIKKLMEINARLVKMVLMSLKRENVND
jgi:hypothetical protein|tara:strand:- start:74 stop:175 length:102 start_codon:yes stop_codon:yes gene_type:complete